MPEHNLLIHSCSPCCPIEAFLEEDGNTCYFYLWIKPETDEASMHACFVSNVKDKCHAIPYEEWKKNPQGPPMMPYEVVTHSQSGLTFDEEELEIVWTKEGSGAGLLWKGDLIAFIPEWSNEEFPGFSKFVKEQTPYACHMEQALEHLEQMVKEGRDFWRQIENEYWPEFQKNHLNSIENYIGKTDKYYAIDGGEFPPKALVTGEKEGVLYGITLGVSILRQPMVESFYQERTPEFSRIELGFACKAEQVNYFMPMLKRISGAAGLPWRQITSLGHGHTIRNDEIDGFAAVWLLNANLLPAGASPVYEPSFGERVNLLWLVPVTQEEYDFLMKYDMEKLFHLDLEREMVIFDGTPKVPIERLKELAGKELV